MRSIIVLLLLFIVFFIGILFGSESDPFKNKAAQYDANETPDVLYKSEHLSDISRKVEKASGVHLDQELTATQSQPIHITYKIARFLEMAIKGFYEIIVSILYQISALFF